MNAKYILLTLLFYSYIPAFCQCDENQSSIIEKAKNIASRNMAEGEGLMIKEVIKIVNAEEDPSPLFGPIWTNIDYPYSEKIIARVDSPFYIWKVLFDLAVLGEIPCYSPEGYAKIEKDELLEMLYDTVEWIGDDNKIVQYVYPLYPNAFDYVVIENWYILNNNTITSEIYAIAPVLECHEEYTVDISGYKLVCWFILNPSIGQQSKYPKKNKKIENRKE